MGLLCNFYALGKLNLSDANMLNKLSPFFAIIFSILQESKPHSTDSSDGDRGLSKGAGLR